MKHTSYKGIVMKITDHHIVLLQDDGTFKNVPKHAVKQVPLLGQSITHVEKASSLRWLPYMSIAALLLLSFLSYSLFHSVKPSYLLVIDINPSIEMEVSEQGDVIELRALNEDGEKVVSSIKDPNQDVLHIIDLIVKDAEKKGYLVKNPMIMTSLISLEETDTSLPVKEINAALISYVQGEDVLVEVKEATLGEYKNAEKANLSVNYYQQYQTLLEKGLIEGVNDIKGKAMAELKSLAASQPNQILEVEEENDTGQSEKTDQKGSLSKTTEQQPKQEKARNEDAKEHADQNKRENRKSLNSNETDSNEKESTNGKNNADNQKSKNEPENKGNGQIPTKEDNSQKEPPEPAKAEERDKEDPTKQQPIEKEIEKPEENQNQRSDTENPSVEQQQKKENSTEEK